MIYYTPYEKIVNIIEDENYILGDSVNLDNDKGIIAYDLWGNGCLYEADEFFQTFCIMRYDFQPIMLEDEEYTQLKLCGICHFSKARKKFIKELQKKKNLDK